MNGSTSIWLAVAGVLMLLLAAYLRRRGNRAITTVTMHCTSHLDIGAYMLVGGDLVQVLKIDGSTVTVRKLKAKE